MTLTSAATESIRTLRKLPVLLVPPILATAILPFAYVTFLVRFTLPIISFAQAPGQIVFAMIVSLLVYLFVFLPIEAFLQAGQAYMSFNALSTGQTSMRQLVRGGWKFLRRAYIGRIIIGLAYVLPIIVGLVVFLLTVPSLLVADVLQFLSMFALNLLVIFFPIFTLELLFYVATYPWMQVLVAEDKGVFSAIRHTVGFVKENMGTMTALAVISLATTIAIAGVYSGIGVPTRFSRLIPGGPEYPLVSIGPFIRSLLGFDEFLRRLVQGLVQALFILWTFALYSERKGVARNLIA